MPLFRSPCHLLKLTWLYDGVIQQNLPGIKLCSNWSFITLLCHPFGFFIRLFILLRCFTVAAVVMFQQKVAFHVQVSNIPLFWQNFSREVSFLYISFYGLSIVIVVLFYLLITPADYCTLLHQTILFLLEALLLGVKMMLIKGFLVLGSLILLFRSVLL